MAGDQDFVVVNVVIAVYHYERHLDEAQDEMEQQQEDDTMSENRYGQWWIEVFLRSLTRYTLDSAYCIVTDNQIG